MRLHLPPLLPQNRRGDHKRRHHRGPPRLKQKDVNIFHQQWAARSHRLWERGGPVLSCCQPEQECAGEHQGPGTKGSLLRLLQSLLGAVKFPQPQDAPAAPPRILAMVRLTTHRKHKPSLPCLSMLCSGFISKQNWVTWTDWQGSHWDGS